MKKLSNEEAVQAFKDGKLIRMRTWPEGEYIRLIGSTVFDDRGKIYSLYVENVIEMIRYGGDQWCLFAPNETATFLKEATETWESFRKCLNAYPIEEGHNELRTHAQTLGIIWEQMVERIKTESK